MLKYNEDVGELLLKDENGNRIKLRFATMLAKNGLSDARVPVEESHAFGIFVGRRVPN